MSQSTSNPETLAYLAQRQAWLDQFTRRVDALDRRIDALFDRINRPLFFQQKGPP